MSGATAPGRRRSKARRKQQARLGVLPLIRAKDHGRPVRVTAPDVGEAGTSGRWAETFVELNRPALRRLWITPSIRGTGAGVEVDLTPSSALGAVPLLAPSTRRVTAGLMVEPRFGWSRIGSVLADVGFSTAPVLGGLPMVPGSAREVPPWILAGPVLMRLALVISRLNRAFGITDALRSRPRGRVDWNEYATRGLPSGRWDRFHCHWPELQHDPWMTSTLRWTLTRIRQDLERVADSHAALHLVEIANSLLRSLGQGPTMRPDPGELDRRSGRIAGDILQQALEGVGWVADERGLGGARVLDGVAWSLGADVLWESWVEAFVGQLAARLGGRRVDRAHTRRRIRWEGRPSTLNSLEPDIGLRLGERLVWFDAKYKFHLQNLRWKSWSEQSETTRRSHRADVHQALAYAALSDAPQVDTVLAYPMAGDAGLVTSVAHVPAGRRGVRLVLLGLPFGCRSPDHRESTLAAVEGLFR